MRPEKYLTAKSTLLLLAPLLAIGCERVVVCGNGVQEGAEACDDGNDLSDDGCNTRCALPECGNNLQDAGEACDDGNAAAGDGCRPDCSAELCGDGIVDAGEQCDDANQIDDDACDNNCASATCGDGILSVDEECDDDNNTPGDGCRADCTIEECGDGTLDGGEGCDDGNTANDDGCDSLCEIELCGNGAIDDPEECDDANNIDLDACRNDCTLPVCGDGVVSLGEGCDDSNTIPADGCAADCSKFEVCGDGFVDVGEGCDDGGTLNGDGCNSFCEREFCGDGVINNTDEQCDDNNTIASDACTDTCQDAICGDGIKQNGVEECDDGNQFDGDDGCDSLCQGTDLTLRIVAGNLTSGNFQSYDLGHGIRIFQGMDADVALVQEFKFGNNSVATLRGFVDTTFGPEHSFFRESTSSNGDIPNAVVSRFPIIEAGEEDDPEVTNRDFVWARIDLPNTTKDLWAISLHLLTSGSARPLEADALVAFIQANIPAGDYLVLGGDLNADSRTESAIVKLGAVVLTGAPHPSDQDGNTNTNANRSKPFDWVLADADLDPLQVPTVFGPFTFPDGLVFDSRLFLQSELNASFSPILVSDSAAASMQHMAVVRDFFLLPE